MYESKTWTIKKERGKVFDLESFETWLWTRIERTKWIEKIGIEDVLKMIGDEKSYEDA